jgi:hypothetical protein
VKIFNSTQTFKNVFWKLELILIIGSNNVLTEGARKVYRGRRVGQGCSRVYMTSSEIVHWARNWYFQNAYTQVLGYIHSHTCDTKDWFVALCSWLHQLYYVRSVSFVTAISRKANHGFCYSPLYLFKFINIRLMCRIWGSRNGSYESCHLLGYSAVWSIYEPTFRRNISPLSSGLKIRRARNQLARLRGYVPPKRRFT